MQRQPRQPLFLGCEGSSEHSYGTLLSRLASSSGLIKVHVHAENLNPGAGDPVQLVRKAVQKIVEREARREPFFFKSLILDRSTNAFTVKAEALARKEGIDLLIWQDPDHEGFLLRHLPNCQALRPTAGASMRALLKQWPEYEKATPAIKLAQRISLSDICVACEVEPALRLLLGKIGFLDL